MSSAIKAAFLGQLSLARQLPHGRVAQGQTNHGNPTLFAAAQSWQPISAWNPSTGAQYLFGPGKVPFAFRTFPKHILRSLRLRTLMPPQVLWQLGSTVRDLLVTSGL